MLGVVNKDIPLWMYLQCANKEDIGSETELGLVKGHGYGVTDVKQVKINKSLMAAIGTDTLYLLRLRNPWGTREWTGPWSDE